jgi:predicted ester cyclase
MTATHQGEFQGFPATGNKIGTTGILIFRIDKGKVVEIREEYDSVGFMQQFGMELKPNEAKKK